VAFKDTQHGVIAGGDYAHPDQGGANLAVTDDGGKTWKLAAVQPQKYFSAVCYVSVKAGKQGLVAVGASDSALSKNSLRTWAFFLSEGFNAIGSADAGVYAVGTNGRVAQFRLK
jgi:photosystem II stability/assembly factor-like uncharacterized protein